MSGLRAGKTGVDRAGCSKPCMTRNIILFAQVGLLNGSERRKKQGSMVLRSLFSSFPGYIFRLVKGLV